MVTQNQWPCPTNLTRLQQKQYNLIQFIRHAYLPFLKTLTLDCGSNDYFQHKTLQMKTLRKIHKTIKNCAQLDSAGCEITHAMKQTLKDGEFYFVLRQICNILHAHKNCFNLNQWNSVSIVDNFYTCNSGLPIVETKQLLIIMDNIKKYAMILYREEFEHLNPGSSTASNIKKYVNVCCATFVLQKVSFKNKDTINMFFKIYMHQLELILHIFKLVDHENEDKRILADFIFSNLMSEDGYHKCPARNGSMTGTLGHAIHTAYVKCRFAQRQLTPDNISRFDSDTIAQITHICGIVKQIRKNATQCASRPTHFDLNKYPGVL